MPADKQKPGQPTKPFTPTLSSNFRATKSPLTPKLAGSTQSTPVHSPRRDLQPAPTGSQPPLARNGLVTPTSSLLNGNVTPRSGARQSRAFESPISPSSTTIPASPSRPVSTNSPIDRAYYNGQGGQGLGILHQPQEQLSGASRFFRADDAKSSTSTSDLDNKSNLPQKKNTFFYASGDPEQPSPPRFINQHSSNTSRIREQPKDSPPTPTHPSVLSSRSPPSAATSPYLPNPDVLRNGPLRPPSPLRESSTISAPGTLQRTIPNHIEAASTTSPNIARTATAPQKQRKSSLGHQTQASSVGHRKSLSNSSQTSIGAGEVNSKPSPSSVPTQNILHQALTASPLMSPIGTISTAEYAVNLLPSEHDPSLSSPVKSDSPAPSQLQKANELAANARRERKVLDLEISNSSLLAINRTLEREMRKQSAELRRFRRLSRAGRLSLVAPSTRSVSGQSGLSILEESDDEAQSEPEELCESDEEDDFESTLDDSDMVNLSPGAQAEFDARQRVRDERRLQLDLSKHQQLLVDSMKMNQSIRRCVAWTDELISEGKKALDYQVRVSDIELGGRVLSVEDDAPETRKGLLSPGTTMDFAEQSQLWADQLGEIPNDSPRDITFPLENQ